MPIYEYQCEDCGAHLEKLQKISDPVLTDCPECNKSSLKKMISATSFRLKGTGWYETDFKPGNKKHGVEGKSDKTKENVASKKDGSDAPSGKGSKANSGKTDESGKSSANTGKSNTNNSAKKETSS